MLLQFGNAAPKHELNPEVAASGAPVVTYMHIPDEYEDEAGTSHYGYDFSGGITPLKQHIIDAHSPYLPPERQGITNMKSVSGHNQEAYLNVVHPSGHWMLHAHADPTWVYSTDEAFGNGIAEHYGCDYGQPDGFEDTHWTLMGNRLLKPGVGGSPTPHVPNGIPDVQMALVDTGRVLFNNMMGGGQVGLVGVGTAATATTLTSATVASQGTNAWANYKILVYSTTGTLIVWGNVVSNTSGTTPVYTVDRWYNAGTPGGAAATTPTTPWSYILLDGGSTSAWFGALSTTNTATVHTDTSMAGEITTASGGLIRKLVTFTQTSGVSPTAFTLGSTWTVNGSDTIPQTIYRGGFFTSMVEADTSNFMMWETLLSASATVAAVSDAITATDTITGS